MTVDAVFSADIVLKKMKIISGGQTGADRAALDFALSRGIEHGGWCPAGRIAEDGPLHPRYQLTATQSAGYRQRTKRNIEQADATIIISTIPLQGGSALTARLAAAAKKPLLVLDISDPDPVRIQQWLEGVRPATLNIAGPSELRAPGIYMATLQLLKRAFG